MIAPELYVRNHCLQRRGVKWTLSKYIDKINFHGDDDLVVDIGCGPGDITWEILKPQLPPKARIVGVDLSKEMLEYAKKHYPGLKYIQLDIATNNLPQELHTTFHHAFSFYVFHRIGNLRQAFVNVFNMLKMGGYFTICVPVRNDIYCVYEYLIQNSKWTKVIMSTYCDNIFHHFSQNEEAEDSLKELLTNIGFEVLIFQCKQEKFEFENMTHFANFLKPIDELYLQLPKYEKEEYLNDWLMAYKKLFLQENCEKCPLHYEIFNLCVKKPAEYNFLVEQITKTESKKLKWKSPVFELHYSFIFNLVNC